MKTTHTIGLSLFLLSCAHDRAFSLREPMWRDTDLASVSVPCHDEPTKKDPHHVSCAPAVYFSPIYWDGADNLVFRPVSEAAGLVSSGEAVNVNSMDEVPDSAWFTNRLGKHPMTIEELRLGACTPDQILDPEHSADGTWVVDGGKMEGSTAGFRINVPGKGKYMLKAEPKNEQPERQAAGSRIGAAIHHAAGYYTSCEQIVYVRPALLKLTAGLDAKANFGNETAFNQRVLDKVLASSTKRGALVRLTASAWLPGFSIGPTKYEGTRGDDPNDIISHEDRRETRALRLLAAWIERHDARQGNTLDSWFADDKKVPDSSPGHVIHYQLDMSEALGAGWAWDSVSRRLGHSYIFDWGDTARDLVTLGIPLRPWDTAKVTPGHEIFGYYSAREFEPDAWKSEYPNAAFSRMTERDAAWIARIMARFTPPMVSALAAMGEFTSAGDTAYLAQVLQARLDAILERYLTRLSSISDLRVDGDALCGVDLAEWRGLRPTFHYGAHRIDGEILTVTTHGAGKLCVTLPHVAADGADARYTRIVVEDGVSKGPLVAHLYDLGPTRGYALAGIERPTR
jgi:hypothetical protein